MIGLLVSMVNSILPGSTRRVAHSTSAMIASTGFSMALFFLNVIVAPLAGRFSLTSMIPFASKVIESCSYQTSRRLPPEPLMPSQLTILP